MRELVTWVWKAELRTLTGGETGDSVAWPSNHFLILNSGFLCYLAPSRHRSAVCVELTPERRRG